MPEYKDSDFISKKDKEKLKELFKETKNKNDNNVKHWTKEMGIKRLKKMFPNMKV